jgi:hypothetical protein
MLFIRLDWSVKKMKKGSNNQFKSFGMKSVCHNNFLFHIITRCRLSYQINMITMKSIVSALLLTLSNSLNLEQSELLPFLFIW